LIKRAVDAGHRISTIVGLDAGKLADLARTAEPWSAVSDNPLVSQSADPEGDSRAAVAAALSAVTALDAAGLRVALQQAALKLTRQTIIDKVVSPLMRDVGRRWADGQLRIVHGHLAAQVVGTHLDRMLYASGASPAKCPRVLIAAPAGQLCDLGARAVAVMVRDHGWEPLFMGANLPSDEIAAACDALQPHMVALSITCRIDDAFMCDELKKVATFVEDRCPLVAGGRCVERYRGGLEANGATVCTTTEHFLSLLH
jgi:methanogenic corrinoid protein MtbC1